MFTSIDAKRVLFNLIGTIFVPCIFLTIGCNGSAYLKQKLQQCQIDLIAAEAAKKKTEEERDTANRLIGIAEAAKKKAEEERDTANRFKGIAEAAKKKAEEERGTANRLKGIAEAAKKKTEEERDQAEEERDQAEEERDTANRLKRLAEAAKKKTEEERDQAEEERDTANRLKRLAEAAKKRAEGERDTANRLKGIAEAAKRLAERERDTANQRADKAEARADAAEKIVSLVPQAKINVVRINKKKTNIDIDVEFSIKNRKGIKCSVIGDFYLKNGRKLLDKNRKQIRISEEFTPKKVRVEKMNVNFSIRYARLNLGQPEHLEIEFRIYDGTTESYLESQPYSKAFHYNN